jgi:hypothetical protein
VVPAHDNFAKLAAPLWHQIQFTKTQTTHCFLTFSEYIAPQRIKACPVPLAGLPFWEMRPIETRDF